MNELGWLLLMDLSGCVLVALLLTALTGDHRGRRRAVTPIRQVPVIASGRRRTRLILRPTRAISI